MSHVTPYRIDSPSPKLSGPVRRRRRAGASISIAAAAPEGQTPGGTAVEFPAEWLDLHADELIRRLQAWAADLDAREAMLNARASLQENRERQFRLRRQDALAAQQEQQRSIERLKRELETSARRLAFRND